MIIPNFVPHPSIYLFPYFIPPHFTIFPNFPNRTTFAALQRCFLHFISRLYTFFPLYLSFNLLPALDIFSLQCPVRSLLPSLSNSSSFIQFFLFHFSQSFFFPLLFPRSKIVSLKCPWDGSVTFFFFMQNYLFNIVVKSFFRRFVFFGFDKKQPFSYHRGSNLVFVCSEWFYDR